MYGESAEKQERVAEELGVEVDVEEDDYCCARKDRLGKTVCLSGGGGEPRRLSKPLRPNGAGRPVEKRMPLRS